MTIGAVNGNYALNQGQMGCGATDDPTTKSIQDKIASAQKELKELSANTEMSMEQKQKKRQELQQEISDLNMQLRQHQMEQKQKERQEKAQSMDELMGTAESQRASKQSGEAGNANNSTGFSAVGMEALISADGARKAAQMQGSVSARLEGRASTLEAEIKLDAARGGNTERKEAEIASFRQKAQTAQTSQISTLQEANEKLQEASRKDAAGESQKEDAVETDSAEKTSKEAEEKEKSSETEKAGTEDKSDASGYTSVDVRI